MREIESLLSPFGQNNIFYSSKGSPMKAVSLALAFLLSSAQVIACNPNPLILQIPADAKYVGDGLTKEEWNQIFDKVESIYQPFLKPAGVEFKVDRQWDNASVNGTVGRTNNLWTIIIYGGYARTKQTTKDALAMIACHEIGHHLGETSYYPAPYEWASVEGQADYYSTTKCLRKYFADEDNIEYLQDKEIPATLKERCEKAWSNENEIAICIRSALAGLQMNLVWTQGTRSFDFHTPDTSVVTSIQLRHPAYQCRLDTYFQGALCSVDHMVAMSKEDKFTGNCNERDGHKEGFRPSCWYKE
jgi:hypothetical protein